MPFSQNSVRSVFVVGKWYTMVGWWKAPSSLDSSESFSTIILSDLTGKTEETDPCCASGARVPARPEETGASD